jgi:hypothetical protein
MKAIDLHTVPRKTWNNWCEKFTIFECFEITVKPRWEDYHLGDVASCKLINLRVQVW